MYLFTEFYGRPLGAGTNLKAASAMRCLNSALPGLLRRFEHVLEAPTSMMTPRGEDTVTYLNKGEEDQLEHAPHNK